MAIEPSASAVDQASRCPPSFYVMVKPRGPLCNLDCAYCYYRRKEELYPGGTFRMTDVLLEDFTRQYIESQRVPEITFSWQGGEPTLMGLDFFRKAVELQGKYRKPGMKVMNALQTNGTTLDAEWCRFFHDHNFLVGLSLDGPRDVHDAYRHDRGGAPTFDRVMAGLALLKQHEVEFNILACVHAVSAARPLDVYRFFRDEAKAAFLQFIPIIEREGGEGGRVTSRSVTGRQYGDFLIRIFDEWVRRDIGRVFVQVFDMALGVWVGQRPALCVYAETCGTALVMEHSGDVYACDHFVDPAHKVGNMLETPLADLVGSAQQRQFGLAKRDALPRCCRECRVLFACNGACPKDRIALSPDGEPGLNILCDGYKAFFTHVDGPMRAMAAELRAGRPASNIMQPQARVPTGMPASRPTRHAGRPGRNDPCPCGSGLKFKRCHGRGSA